MVGVATTISYYDISYLMILEDGAFTLTQKTTAFLTTVQDELPGVALL
jgi:hypothetical protein